MARYEITAPDGGRYEITAPDNAGQDEVLAYAQQNYQGASAATAGTRSEAYDGWGQYLKDLGRTAAQGTTLGFGDEIIAGARSLAGTPYEQAVGEERAAVERFAELNPGTALGAELVGGLAVPGGLGAARFIGRGASVFGQGARGAGVGAGYGAGAAAGKGEGGLEERLETAESGLGPGAVIGSVIPGAASAVQSAVRKAQPYVSPKLARLKAAIGDRIKLPGMSADGSLPVAPGAAAEAEQVIANQMYRAGSRPEALMRQLEEADEAATMWSSGQAQNALAPVDLDPSLQRLGGSAVRASPEAGNIAQTFITSRQTGKTPATGQQVVGGLPTREPLSPAITGKQATGKYGTDFGAGQKNLVPMGQFERIKDALKRAFTIKDTDFHGHAGNAYRTEQQILEAAESGAKRHYGVARAAAKGYSLTPHIEPVMQKWADRIASAQMDEGDTIKAALKKFTTGDKQLVKTLENFDKAKRQLDDEIGMAVRAGERSKAAILTEMKRDFVGAVDGIKHAKIGERYAAARQIYSSHMEANNALQMGRDVWKLDSDVGVDLYRSLQTEGERKLFRLGVLDGFEKLGKQRKLTADVVQSFETPRMQELLAEVIPRSQKGSAEFARRPERFGRFLANEKRMIETRNQVLGGSQTQMRAVDDDAFEMINQSVERMRGALSPTGMATRVLESGLKKIFGMRADTSAALAQMLFNAQPQQRVQILQAVAGRMQNSQDRMARLAELLASTQRAAPAAAMTAGGATQ